MTLTHIDDILRMIGDATKPVATLKDNVGRRASHITKALPEDIHFAPYEGDIVGSVSQKKMSMFGVSAHNEPGFKPDYDLDPDAPPGWAIPNRLHSSAAYGYVHGYMEAPKQLHLDYIKSSLEGSGVGKELLNKFVEQGRRRGATHMSGDVVNPRALANRLKMFGENETKIVGSTKSAREFLETSTDADWDSPVQVLTRIAPDRPRVNKYRRPHIPQLNPFGNGHSSARSGLPVRSSAPGSGILR